MGFLVEALPASGLIERLPLPFVRRANRAAKELDTLAYTAIQRARDANHPGEDVVSHLVRATEEGRADWSYNSDQEIRDEAYALLFGAYEPPVVVIVNALHYLALNPAAREALEHEADTLLDDQPISGADLERLPYARAVALESLRLHPVAEPLVGRIALEDTTLGGYSVPKGTRVQVSPASSSAGPSIGRKPTSSDPNAGSGTRTRANWDARPTPSLPSTRSRATAAGHASPRRSWSAPWPALRNGSGSSRSETRCRPGQARTSAHFPDPS